MAGPQFNVVGRCPHCLVEDLGSPDIPVTDTGEVVCRVVWNGMASMNGMPMPVVRLDIAAGQLPNRLEFPQVERWVPVLSYCPNCLTQFYAGPDWRDLEREQTPQILVPR